MLSFLEIMIVKMQHIYCEHQMALEFIYTLTQIIVKSHLIQTGFQLV